MVLVGVLIVFLSVKMQHQSNIRVVRSNAGDTNNCTQQGRTSPTLIIDQQPDGAQAASPLEEPHRHHKGRKKPAKEADISTIMEEGQGGRAAGGLAGSPSSLASSASSSLPAKQVRQSSGDNSASQWMPPVLEASWSDLAELNYDYLLEPLVQHQAAIETCLSIVLTAATLAGFRSGQADLWPDEDDDGDGGGGGGGGGDADGKAADFQVNLAGRRRARLGQRRGHNNPDHLCCLHHAVQVRVHAHQLFILLHAN